MRLVLLACAACTNSLPSSHTCDIATATGDPVVTPVPLGGGGWDDLRYAPALGKVVAAPEGSGMLFLIDPTTLAKTQLAVPPGTATADAAADVVIAIDRGADRMLAIDPVRLEIVATFDLHAHTDYVRVSPAGDEAWVTLPGAYAIQVVTITRNPLALAAGPRIRLPGSPEGLSFGAGRAFTHANNSLTAIDIATHSELGQWDIGCGRSHGFPQIDDGYGFVVAGCADYGGIEVIDTNGPHRSGYETGSGFALLAMNQTLHHLYVRGDPGGELSMLSVCPDTGLSVLAKVPIPPDGHALTVDDHDDVWVGDADNGGVIRIHDPFTPQRAAER